MKRLNIEDRMLIQACLSKNMTITEIAQRLNKNKSTISREINNHLSIKEGYYDKKCTNFKKYRICNSCPRRGSCGYEKRYYNYEEADDISRKIRSSSRRFTRLRRKELLMIDEILNYQVKGLRQSLHHVYISSLELKKICSERTIRRLIYNGFTKVKSHDLRRYVAYKHCYEKPKEFRLRDISVLIGRQFSDYLKYIQNHKRLNRVQYDSVIGKTSDEKAILTVTFEKYNFQFGILIKKTNPDDVVAKIRKLFRSLGSEVVKEIFAINLADNGVEFSYFNKIEYDDDGEVMCKTFFTNPYKATDKSRCERCHELLRYILPKGKSLDFLTQEKVDWIFSQINSYVRESLGNQTPYDVIRRKFGEKFLETIGIFRVEKKKVDLRQMR